jgi:hypothetical protein
VTLLRKRASCRKVQIPAFDGSILKLLPASIRLLFIIFVRLFIHDKHYCDDDEKFVMIDVHANLEQTSLPLEKLSFSTVRTDWQRWKWNSCKKVANRNHLNSVRRATVLGTENCIQSAELNVQAGLSALHSRDRHMRKEVAYIFEVKYD